MELSEAVTDTVFLVNEDKTVREELEDIMEALGANIVQIEEDIDGAISLTVANMIYTK